MELPAEDVDTAELGSEARDTVVGRVYGKLMEIESRLLPCGLHVVGVPPSAEEAVATLVNIAGIDRPESDLLGLPNLLARAVGRDIESVYRNNDKGVLDDVTLLVAITEASRTGACGGTGNASLSCLPHSLPFL